MAGIAVLDNMQRGLTALPGVKAIITVQNSTALPVRTTISSNLSAVIAHHVLKIIPKARAVLLEVDPTDSIAFFRIRGRNFEYLVVLDKEYTMIAIQEHTFFEPDANAGPATNGALQMHIGVADENSNRPRHFNLNRNNANINRNNAAGVEATESNDVVDATVQSAESRPIIEADPQQRGKSKRGSAGASGSGNATSNLAVTQSALYRRLRGVGSGVRSKTEIPDDLDFIKVNFMPRQ